MWRRSRIKGGFTSLFGAMFIGASIFLFQPESSEIIAGLLGWT